MNRNYQQILDWEGCERGSDMEDEGKKALFHIIANNEELFKKIDHIYDFDERCAKSDCIDGTFGVLSSSEKALVKLGLNLYNCDFCNANVSYTFQPLDKKNFKLAMEAIRIRFCYLSD